MQINQYQFQSQIFKNVCEGISEEDLRKDALARKAELRHLAGANPNDKEFKETVLKVISQIVKDVAKGPTLGPLATADLRLWGKEQDLGGRVLNDLNLLQPNTVDDREEIKDVVRDISQKLCRKHMLDADLLLDGKYTAEILDLYGRQEPLEDELEAQEKDATKG